MTVVTLKGITEHLAVLHRCVLSCDLKEGNESLFLSWAGLEFQRRGAVAGIQCSAFGVLDSYVKEHEVVDGLEQEDIKWKVYKWGNVREAKAQRVL